MVEASPLPAAAPPDDAELLFDTELRPRRSLSRGGFWLLMALTGVACGIGAAVFLAFGAWPVSGFFGLDIVLLYGAFRLSYRTGRSRETLRLTRETLTVRRISPAGRIEAWIFQPYWLRVELAESRRHGRLTLLSHGRRLTVGAFLSPQERADLAVALRAALEHCRRAPAPAG